MSVLDQVAQLMVQPVALFAPYTITDRYGSGGAKWLGGLSGKGFLGINHSTARRNARNAMQDSPLARAIVERKADCVADVGLRLELCPVTNVLGISINDAAKWARNTEARFHLWASDKRQHRSETMTFYQMQRLYQLFRGRDGDIFIRLFYNSDPSLQNPLQWEFIDPDQIRGDALTSTYGFQGGDDGIIRDERGRETAYKIWSKQADGTTYKDVTIPAKSADGSRLFMLHAFRPEYAGQGRGYSPLAHAIQEFENITDFSAATIKKAINQSNIVAFVEPAKDEDASNPLEHLLNQQAGPAAQLFGSNPTPVDGIPVVPTREGVASSYLLPEANIDTPGSMFIANLTKGSTIKFPANTAPGDSYDKFVDAFAGYLAASTSTPLEVVLMKFGQNYSASRATLLLFWRIVGSEIMEMDSDALSPMVAMWMAGEIANGQIVAPGWSDPRLRAAWLAKNWIGAPPPDIDPTKTANARRLNCEGGFSSVEREARELNGSSAAANIESNRQLFKDFPVAPWTVTGGGGPTDDSKGDDKE